MRKNGVSDKMLHGADYSPEQWLKYSDILEEDLKLMKLAHTNTFSIGMFSWASLEVEEGVYDFSWLDRVMDGIARNGSKVALATPSGARPTWMSHKYPEVLRTNAKREKMLHGHRHNHCLTSPIYRKKVKEINHLLAERYKNHPALLMWHISNEYSGDCHCNICQSAFRAWLKIKYTTLDALNHAWWGPFWSHTITDWGQLESPSPIGETMVHGQNLDWKRFVTDQTIDFYLNECNPLKKITPDIPCTTNFMADTTDLLPFWSLDYSKFANYVDILSWDCYPTWHNDWESTSELAMKVGFINDLYRSLKQKTFLILESTPSGVNWHPVNKFKRPGMHLLSSMQFLAHGSDSIMYFQWRKSRGSSEKFHGAVVDHDRNINNRVFQDVIRVGESLEKLSDIVATMPNSKVGILYDWENNWALEDAQAYAKETKKYAQTCQQHYKVFWEKDIQVDVITKEQNFSTYKLLIAPMLYLISEDLMKKFEVFVQNGGHLVLTYISGIVNEHDLVYMNGWHKKLQNIFGIDVKEIDTFYPKDRNSISVGNIFYEVRDYASILEVINSNVEVAATYNKDFYANTPAVTANTYGNGVGYYLGARISHDFHVQFYQEILEKLEITPSIPISHKPGVSIQVREDDMYKFIFIMNFTEQEQDISFEFEALDMLNEELVQNNITLNTYDVRILKLKK